MNERNLLDEIYRQKDQKELEEINMLKTNKKINSLVKDICKESIRLAKINLINSNKDEENKINLSKIIEKNIEKYNKLNSIKYNCNICKDKIIINGKICNCARNMIKRNCVESIDEDLTLNSFNFNSFDLKYYPDKFDNKLNCSFRTFMSKNLDFCLNYSKTFNEDSENLLFIGGTGLGKTHLSCSIANEVEKSKFSVSYISFPKELIENSKISDNDFNRKKKLNSDLLIIDDLGIENSTSFSNSFLFNVINTRVMKGLQTILVTNLSIKLLEKIYGQTILSRIMGNFLKVSFVGNDVRQQSYEKKLKKRGEL